MHAHTKHIVLWPHWFKHHVGLLTSFYAKAMSLLLIRHAGSHEATATSALSSSGMCGGSAAPPGQGNLFVR